MFHRERPSTVAILAQADLPKSVTWFRYSWLFLELRRIRGAPAVASALTLGQLCWGPRRQRPWLSRCPRRLAASAATRSASGRPPRKGVPVTVPPAGTRSTCPTSRQTCLSGARLLMSSSLLHQYSLCYYSQAVDCKRLPPKYNGTDQFAIPLRTWRHYCGVQFRKNAKKFLCVFIN
jgi:hypothetical protein